MYRLENRLARLERYQEETEEDNAVTIRLSFEGQSDQPPREPGTRVLHVTLDGPSWWGVVNEDGTEEWIGYA